MAGPVTCDLFRKVAERAQLGVILHPHYSRDTIFIFIFIFYFDFKLPYFMICYSFYSMYG